MMTKLANDPAFWGAVVAVCGFLAAYFKAKTAEIETKNTQERVTAVSSSQEIIVDRVNQHAAALAALQASAQPVALLPPPSSALPQKSSGVVVPPSAAGAALSPTPGGPTTEPPLAVPTDDNTMPIVGAGSAS